MYRIILITFFKCVFLLLVQHNVMVFIAELFWWFETVKPEFVQPRDLQEFKDCKSKRCTLKVKVHVINSINSLTTSAIFELKLSLLNTHQFSFKKLKVISCP